MIPRSVKKVGKFEIHNYRVIAKELQNKMVDTVHESLYKKKQVLGFNRLLNHIILNIRILPQFRNIFILLKN